MALAYLWTEAGGDKEPFSSFWKLVGDESEMHRFMYADRRLDEICKRLGMARDLEASQTIWSEVHSGRGTDR